MAPREDQSLVKDPMDRASALGSSGTFSSLRHGGAKVRRVHCTALQEGPTPKRCPTPTGWMQPEIAVGATHCKQRAPEGKEGAG